MASILDSLYKDTFNTMNFDIKKYNIIFLGTTWKVHNKEGLEQIYGLVLKLAWNKGRNYDFRDIKKSLIVVLNKADRWCWQHPSLPILTSQVNLDSSRFVGGQTTIYLNGNLATE